MFTLIVPTFDKKIYIYIIMKWGRVGGEKKVCSVFFRLKACSDLNRIIYFFGSKRHTHNGKVQKTET